MILNAHFGFRQPHVEPPDVTVHIAAQDVLVDHRSFQRDDPPDVNLRRLERGDPPVVGLLHVLLFLICAPFLLAAAIQPEAERDETG